MMVLLLSFRIVQNVLPAVLINSSAVPLYFPGHTASFLEYVYCHPFSPSRTVGAYCFSVSNYTT